MTRLSKSESKRIENAESKRQQKELEELRKQGITFTEQELDDIKALDARRGKSPNKNLKNDGNTSVLLKQIEAKKALSRFDSSQIQGIRNKLGLSSSASQEKLEQEVARALTKSKATQKALGLID